MTAEIVIMNKEAIALASDSAVTMTGKLGEKIFTSANKIFALSKYHPIGVMVYGNATFMGVPWEIIIKIYRNNLGKKKFNTLKEYAKGFITFLDNSNPLFPDSTQEEYLRSSIYAYFDFIKNSIKETVRAELYKKDEITDETTKQIVSDTIRKHYENFGKINNIPSIPKSFNKSIIDKYGKIINKTIKEVFEELPISKTSVMKI